MRRRPVVGFGVRVGLMVCGWGVWIGAGKSSPPAPRVLLRRSPPSRLNFSVFFLSFSVVARTPSAPHRGVSSFPPTGLSRAAIVASFITDHVAPPYSYRASSLPSPRLTTLCALLRGTTNEMLELTIWKYYVSLWELRQG